MIGLRYAALMEDFDKIQEEMLNCDINSNKEATKTILPDTFSTMAPLGNSC